jgi:hypothetical protein
MWRKIAKSFILGTVLLAFAAPTYTSAETSTETLYDKGRAYNYYLDNNPAVNNYSTVVMSVQANYYNSQGWGRERIRMWSRMDTINEMYPPSEYENWVAKMNLRFYTDDPRASALMLSATDPVTKTTNYTIPDIAYDIAGYFGSTPGVILGTIQALANLMATQGTERIEDSAHDNTIVFYQPDLNVANLPNTISYSDADGQLNGNNGGPHSGADAKFQYNLPSNQTSFKLWPQGQIQYETWANWEPYPWYFWTGAVNIHHTVN